MKQREPEPSRPAKEPDSRTAASEPASTPAGQVGPATSRDTILFLQRHAGNQAVQRLLIQRTLADVDPPELEKLWKVVKTAIGAELADGAEKAACEDLTVKVLQAMASRAIDLYEDSAWYCTMLENFLPGRLKGVFPEGTDSIGEYVTALGSVLGKVHAAIVDVAVRDIGSDTFSVQVASDALNEGKKALELEGRGTTKNDEGFAALFGGPAATPSTVPPAFMAASRPLYDLGQKLGDPLGAVIDEVIRQTATAAPASADSPTPEADPGALPYQTLLDSRLLAAVISLDLHSIGDVGLKMLLKSFAPIRVHEVAEKLLLSPERNTRLSGGQQAIVAGHVFGFGISVDDVSADVSPVIEELLRLPQDAVRQHGVEPKWIKSLMVTMKSEHLDAAGGTYNSYDKHIWVGGKQNPTEVAGTVRHEVGHAIDERIGWSKDKKYEAPEHGRWKVYANDADKASMIEEVLAGTKDPSVGWPAEARTWARDALVRLLKSPIFPFAETPELQDRLDSSGGGSAEAYVQPLFASEAFRMIDSLRGNSNTWRFENGGRVLGERVYTHNASYNQWMSFDLRARATKVSNYQFYAPAEWFAELYSHYYATEPRGEAIPPAAKTAIEAILKIGTG